MKRFVWLALSALFFNPAASSAQGGWAGFNAYFENDTFTGVGQGSDDGFTNGLRIQIARDPNAGKIWVDMFEPISDRLLEVFTERARYPTNSLVLGQNFFTPRTITVYEPDPSDRPFAGLAFLGIRSEATESLAFQPRMMRGEENPEVICHSSVGTQCQTKTQSQTQVALEVSLGVLGPGAGSRILQAGAHVSPSNSRVPKGWHTQLSNRIHASVFGQVRHRWARDSRNGVSVDLTPDGVINVGTSQTFLGGGLTARIGRNLSGFPTQAGINNAVEAGRPRATVEYGLSVGISGRAYAWNGFVNGILGDDPDIAIHRLVGDYRLGAFLRAGDWQIDWLYQIRRSPEVKEAGPSQDLYDSYGSLQLSRDPEGVTTFFEKLQEWRVGRVVKGFFLDANFGWERDRTSIVDDAPVVRTTAFHAGAGVLLPWGLDAGIEISGVGREFPREAEDHRDRFLNQKGFALGWAPRFGLFNSRVGELRFRIGRQGGTEELEVTPNAPGVRASACPAGTSPKPGQSVPRYCTAERDGDGGWTYGVGYTFNLGYEAGLNVSWNWHELGLEERYDFSAITVGLRWAPRTGG